MKKFFFRCNIRINLEILMKYLPIPLGIKPYCTPFDPSFTLSLLEDTTILHSILNKGNGYFTSIYDFYVFITMVYQYLLPLMYLTITYTKMSIRLWNSQTPGVDKDCFSKRGSIKMMIAVVVVFAFCWMPWHLFATIKALWREMSDM